MGEDKAVAMTRSMETPSKELEAVLQARKQEAEKVEKILCN